MVPISISGHGIREAGYAYFFGLVGVASAVAVSASVLFFAVVAIATLPGAALFAIGRRLSDVRHAHATHGARERFTRKAATARSRLSRALAEALDLPSLPPSVGAGYTAGIGGQGCVCGALAGGVAALGEYADGARSRARRHGAACRGTLGRVAPAGSRSASVQRAVGLSSAGRRRAPTSGFRNAPLSPKRPCGWSPPSSPTPGLSPRQVDRPRRDVSCSACGTRPLAGGAIAPSAAFGSQRPCARRCSRQRWLLSPSWLVVWNSVVGAPREQAESCAQLGLPPPRCWR